MIRRTRQILLLAVFILIPVSVWLIVGHVRQRSRLFDEVRDRVTSGAEAWAEAIEATIRDTRVRLNVIPPPPPDAPDPIEDAARAIREALPRATVIMVPGSGGPPPVRGVPIRDHDPHAAAETGLMAHPVDRLVMVLRAPSGLLVRIPVLDDVTLAPTVRGRLHVVAAGGKVLVSLPVESPHDPSEQDRRKTSSLATRAAGALERANWSDYRDLEDDAAIGAWHPIGDVGGVVVEELSSDALRPVLGARPWHFTLGFLVLIGLPLGLIEIGRRWPAARSLLRLYAFARPYWAPILFIILAMGLYAAGSGAQLFMIKFLVEDVLLEQQPDAAWRMLLLLSAAMLVVVLAMALGRFAKAYLSAKVTQSVINDIRCEVGRHLLTLSLGFFQKRRQGELLSRLTNDVGQSRKSLGLIFGDLVQEPLMLAGAIAAGFATNWRLALMIFLAFPVLIVPIARYGRKIKRYAKKRQVKRADVTNVMVQMLSGIRIVKAFRMEDHEGRRLREASDRLLKQSLKVARTTAFSETVLEIFNHVGAVAVMLAGGYFVLNGSFDITVADLVTFSAILTRMYKPLKDLTKTYNKIQDSMPGIERVFEVLDYRADIVDGPGARPLGKPGVGIAFEGVSFAYDTEPVLSDITFEAPVGTVVALVGPTGAGKSTLTDLVARYYDPLEGRITIDGTDLRQYSVDSLHSRVAVVTQEPFLFHTTIRENILYGRRDATEEEVEAAARAAFVHGEILEQPHGYDTVVGDRGARLSGGQRQRITIARAILKDADILILDEATSSLDSRSEGEVQSALTNLMEGRTTFVVAHRLSTIRNADRILVLDRGRIVEDGDHDALLAAGGLYAQLHALQEGGAGESPSVLPEAEDG